MHTQITPLASWSDEEICQWFGVNLCLRKKMDNIFQELDLSDHAFLEKRMGRILKQRKSSMSSGNEKSKVKAFLKKKMSKHSQKSLV